MKHDVVDFVSTECSVLSNSAHASSPQSPVPSLPSSNVSLPRNIASHLRHAGKKTMELQHVNVKLFVEGKLPVDAARLIDVFHRWIRESVLDEFLIDVADYRHVPDGPGVMLIGHDVDYSLDHACGRWGLLYNRKAAMEGSNEDRLRQAVASAANACRLLEEEFSGDGLKFSRNELQIIINDRALAPNTPETLTAAQPVLESYLSTLFGSSDFTITPEGDPRRRFGVTVTTSSPFDLAAFLQAAG